jgi:hypothetical protein
MKSSLRTFYNHHHDLINRYGVSLSKMTTDSPWERVASSRGMVPSILVEIITSKDQYLTATEYLCHRPPRICCSHNTILLFSPMTYHRNFNMSNTTGSIRGTRASYSSGATVSFIMFNYWSTCGTQRVTFKWQEHRLLWKSCRTPVCINKYK